MKRIRDLWKWVCRFIWLAYLALATLVYANITLFMSVFAGVMVAHERYTFAVVLVVCTIIFGWLTYLIKRRMETPPQTA
jgi:hypothetical protein